MGLSVPLVLLNSVGFNIKIIMAYVPYDRSIAESLSKVSEHRIVYNRSQTKGIETGSKRLH